MRAAHPARQVRSNAPANSRIPSTLDLALPSTTPRPVGRRPPWESQFMTIEILTENSHFLPKLSTKWGTGYPIPTVRYDIPCALPRSFRKRELGPRADKCYPLQWLPATIESRAALEPASTLQPYSWHWPRLRLCPSVSMPMGATVDGTIRLVRNADADAPCYWVRRVARPPTLPASGTAAR